MEEKKIDLIYNFKSIIASSVFYAIITFFLNSIRETSSLWIVYPMIAIQLYLYFGIFFSLWNWLKVYGFAKTIAFIFTILLAILGRVENWETVIIPLIILVLLMLTKMNSFFSLTGSKLLNFTFVNIWIENEGELLMYLLLRLNEGQLIIKNVNYRLFSDASFKDKWNHYAFKQTIQSKIKSVNNALFELNLFDFGTIEKLIKKEKDTVWDKLLNLIIIRVVSDYSKTDIKISDKQIFNLIVAYFAYEVMKRYKESEQITELKNSKNELEVNMDLLLTKTYYQNNKGQFRKN